MTKGQYIYISKVSMSVIILQVASRSGGLLCFGPVVDDGYGICYNPMDSQLLFAVSSWKNCKITNTRLLSDNIGKALMDAKLLLEHATASKL